MLLLCMRSAMQIKFDSTATFKRSALQKKAFRKLFDFTVHFFFFFCTNVHSSGFYTKSVFYILDLYLDE